MSPCPLPFEGEGKKRAEQRELALDFVDVVIVGTAPRAAGSFFKYRSDDAPFA